MSLVRGCTRWFDEAFWFLKFALIDLIVGSGSTHDLTLLKSAESRIHSPTHSDWTQNCTTDRASSTFEISKSAYKVQVEELIDVLDWYRQPTGRQPQRCLSGFFWLLAFNTEVKGSNAGQRQEAASTTFKARTMFWNFDLSCSLTTKLAVYMPRRLY